MDWSLIIITAVASWFAGMLFLFFLLGWKQEEDHERIPPIVYFQIMLWPVIVVIWIVINILKSPFAIAMNIGRWLNKKTKEVRK